MGATFSFFAKGYPRAELDVRSQLLGLFQDYAAEVEGEMRTVVRAHRSRRGLVCSAR